LGESIRSQRNWLGNQLGLWLVFQLCQGKSENNNSFARKALDLRGDSTVTEQKLWRSLKSKALDYKFKHQYLIGNYIVDFVCLSKLVVVINEETLDFQEVANVERSKVIIEKGLK
jgi:leucyl-tRNA synthetase